MMANYSDTFSQTFSRSGGRHIISCCVNFYQHLNLMNVTQMRGRDRIGLLRGCPDLSSLPRVYTPYFGGGGLDPVYAF